MASIRSLRFLLETLAARATERHDRPQERK
jgi:hypothetical protein